ncbi:MAG: hypothetical protein AAFU66_01775 [Pseudomonadota bacterium]
MKDAAIWIMGSKRHQSILITLMFFLGFGIVIAMGIATASVLAYGVSGSLPVLLSSLVILLIAGLVGPEGGLALPIQAGVAFIAAVAMAMMLKRTRSLTFTIQLSLLAFLAGVVAFWIMVDDPPAFWLLVFQTMLEPIWRTDLTNAETLQLSARLRELSTLATGAVAGGFWLMCTAALSVGNFLWDTGSDRSRERYGRFCDVNLGRALAVLLLVLAVVVSLIGEPGLLMNLAIACFVAFVLHGIALAHWCRVRWALPWFALVPVYLAFLVAWPIYPIAGYIDAWFNFSQRTPSDG